MVQMKAACPLARVHMFPVVGMTVQLRIVDAYSWTQDCPSRLGPEILGLTVRLGVYGHVRALTNTQRCGHPHVFRGQWVYDRGDTGSLDDTSETDELVPKAVFRTKSLPLSDDSKT